MSDYEKKLASMPFWGPDSEWYARSQQPNRMDTILQNRQELAQLCQFIEDNQIRSYLEIGVWTGALLNGLDSIFHFDKLAAADLGVAQQLGLKSNLSPTLPYFSGSSHSHDYRRWRAELGHFDLVMIDADHSYAGVAMDFAINVHFPHRFIAIHDITGDGPECEPVGVFWRQLQGNKKELLAPHPIPGGGPSRLGIGIWSSNSSPS